MVGQVSQRELLTRSFTALRLGPQAPVAVRISAGDEGHKKNTETNCQLCCSVRFGVRNRTAVQHMFQML